MRTHKKAALSLRQSHYRPAAKHAKPIAHRQPPGDRFDGAALVKAKPKFEVRQGGASAEPVLGQLVSMMGELLAMLKGGQAANPSADRSAPGPSAAGSTAQPAPGSGARVPLERWGAVVHNVTQPGIPHSFTDERGTAQAPIKVGRKVTIDTTPHVARGLGERGGTEQPKDQQDAEGPTFRVVSGPEGSNPRHNANPYLIQFSPKQPGTYVFEIGSRNGEGAPARISIVVA